MSGREKHLKVLEELRKTLNVDKGIEFWEEIEALDYGLNVMRKYLKIEELMRGWNNFNSYERMCDIYEVVENGNVD